MLWTFFWFLGGMSVLTDSMPFFDDILWYAICRKKEHMDQKDEDGYYAEECHFFSTSKPKYIN